jgi:hypothetical protein
MPPLADQLRRLIGALHSRFSDDALRPAQARVRAPHRVPIAGGGLYGRGLDPSIAATRRKAAMPASVNARATRGCQESLPCLRTRVIGPLPRLDERP